MGKPNESLGRKAKGLHLKDMAAGCINEKLIYGPSISAFFFMLIIDSTIILEEK